MSLWFCSTCKVLYGFVLRCPKCGNATEFAVLK